MTFFKKKNVNQYLVKSMYVRKVIHSVNKNCCPYQDIYPLLAQLLCGPKNPSWVICIFSQSNGVLYSNTWCHLLLVG